MKKITTFLIVYLPILLIYSMIYLYWFLYDYDFVKNSQSYYRHFIHDISSILFWHIPLLVLFFVVSLFKPSLSFFRCRQKHFIIGFFWWILFFVFDPGLHWFLD